MKVIAEKKTKKGAQRLQIEGYLVAGETALTPLAGWCTKKLFVETSAPDLPPPPSDPTPTAAAAGATEATAEAAATAAKAQHFHRCPLHRAFSKMLLRLAGLQLTLPP